jgi:hypothetical protein
MCRMIWNAAGILLFYRVPRLDSGAAQRRGMAPRHGAAAQCRAVAP